MKAPHHWRKRRAGTEPVDRGLIYYGRAAPELVRIRPARPRLIVDAEPVGEPIARHMALLFLLVAGLAALLAGLHAFGWL